MVSSSDAYLQKKYYHLDCECEFLPICCFFNCLFKNSVYKLNNVVMKVKSFVVEITIKR